MKRRVLKLLLFLLAGAIINIAVAWTIGYTTNTALLSHFMRPEKCSGKDGYEFGFMGTELRLATWGRSDRHDYDRVEWSPFADNKLPKWSAADKFPKWSAFADNEQAEFFDSLPEETHRAFFEYACGWPSLSLRSLHRAALVNVGKYAWSNGPSMLPAVPLPQSQLNYRNGATLPTHPIWPGFAINTIFYAAILWMLFAVPRAVRRRLRHKRGQCAACGYSLRGSSRSESCPECGAAIARGT